ncbi:MAG TPA: gliding motility protein GldN [Prolixibacteraceae bacterium]|nr:gliding motility protein GldN [Bacteroidales bacterium]HNQ36391.1 gliding motility protein GldN [Prolixibacteraceae bacterium]HPJ79138.1 gliding motility protein GldN [Prolixibacteraceae bacterium]HRV89319.1 gliding motility protein GldN [Prolixibacteraceae bacterium]
MKRIVLSIMVMCVVGGLFPGRKAEAQIINGAFKRQDVFQKKPMPVPMVREADVFWSQMVWRIIDVREKINQPLYYPTKPAEGLTNLAGLLLKGVEDGLITAYDARNDDDFKTPMTMAEVKAAFGAETVTREVQNFDTGEMEMRTIEGEIRLEEIKQFMIKEEWYFDKQNSRLQVRIVGICPIQEFYRTDVEGSPVQRRKVFWIYYPEARNLLAGNMVFNPYNDARRMTFDDLFIKRYFNSYIVQESNVYNNRTISQYLSGKEAMLESKRIEDKIFNMEQDLWEY